MTASLTPKRARKSNTHAAAAPALPSPAPSCPLSGFSPATAAWFRGALAAPTEAQALAFPVFCRKESAVVLAPTGSGKTLAAFLAALDQLMFAPEPPPPQRLRVLYISPLKALATDIERNLWAPLAGIRAQAQTLGLPATNLQIAVRTGDTPSRERARIARTPPDILVTTPESVYLLLTSKAREILRHVETVIIDEIHAFLPTKRGTHLALSLERLEQLRGADAVPLQRIGLSATQTPHAEVQQFLAGFTDGAARPMRILDASKPKPLQLSVEMPDVDFSDLTAASTGKEDADVRSIWPHLHARILTQMQGARSTMVFVNSRRLAERLASGINDLAGREVALAHHGSVAQDQRIQIEEQLKQGLLPAIVATSSLELGIDIGAVDQVIQMEAPSSVAAGLQRIGRACHQVGGVPRGILLPKHRADLLACAAIAELIASSTLEPTAYVRLALDVLAQQIVAEVAIAPTTVDALYTWITRAAPYRTLSRSQLEGVLDMLAGRYPSDEFSELRPRINWDRASDALTPRLGAQRLAILNGGTIADRGLYGVFLFGTEEGKPVRVGELDEEMVFELRVGENFFLGASSWRCEEISHDRVLVTPARGAAAKMPFWRGDRAGRSRLIGDAIGSLSAELATYTQTAGAEWLGARGLLNPAAARNLAAYVSDQVRSESVVPTAKLVVCERFTDELGDLRVVLLAPFGMRVLAPWGLVVLARLRKLYGGDTEAVWSDDGIVFRLPSLAEFPDAAVFVPSADELREELRAEVGSTSLFAARFRENAGRALLLPKRFPGRRTALWAQRKRAHDLLAVAVRYAEFPLLLETYREVLADVFDLHSTCEILQDLAKRTRRIVWKDVDRPSPFAESLLFNFVASFVYDGDAPLAERRAQALTIDHDKLRELLGEAELRQLLAPEIIEAVSARLRWHGRACSHPDHVHDALLALGELDDSELAAIGPAGPELARELVTLRRALQVRIAGNAYTIAAEDAARYRDAFGVVLPAYVPNAFLAPVAEPIAGIVHRYARTHGPFAASAVQSRYGLDAAQAEARLGALVGAKRLQRGAFLQHGAGTEYCDAEVLRTLRQRSLALHREAIEPVDAACFVRFLHRHQGVAEPRFGREALLDVAALLQGAPLVLSLLEQDILPARIANYAPAMLDELITAGEVTYQVLEPIGRHDARVMLFLADDEAWLARAPAAPLAIGRTAELRAALQRRGALFFHQLASELGGFLPDLEEALWALVFAGEVSTDSLAALRVQLAPKREQKRRGLRAASGGHRGPQGRFALRSAGSAVSETERQKARADNLLMRHGILAREVAAAEDLPGGFSALYTVLRSLEDAGKVRRGYFVAGLGGAQFARAPADDQLRDERDRTQRAVLLSAQDPACPFGAQVPWPALLGPETRLARATGAQVLIGNGAALAYVHKQDRAWSRFAVASGESADEAFAAALTEIAERRAPRLEIAFLDAQPAALHPLANRLARAGFLREGQALVFRPSAARRPHAAADN